ncbi:MAG: helix-turn-helix transcriptional regulator [Gemmatimonadetes bacterium]|nr:helix-turn-helix transcriptional regulator [Gemmatimonadota bacterium]
MNRTHALLHTSDLLVNRFDHAPHTHHVDPDEETSTRWAIAFVQTGRFSITHGGVSRTLQRGSVLLCQPGERFQCRHHEACPTDVCVSVGFHDGAAVDVEDTWARAGWPAREIATPRLAYVDRRLATAAQHADRFELERWALAAVTALHDDTATVRGRYAARADDVDAVVAACEDIEHDPCARRTIAERARAVGLTSTRLTHSFRRYVGESPHQYVIRWRLGQAASLRDAGWSVSESCYRAGFEHLSHFSRTFQRAFGVRAAIWPALPLAERRRKVQALLTRRV